MSAGEKLVELVEAGVLRSVDIGRRAAVEAAVVLDELPEAITRIGERVDAAVAEVERAAQRARAQPSGDQDAEHDGENDGENDGKNDDEPGSSPQS